MDYEEFLRIFHVWHKTRLENGQLLRDDPDFILCDMDHSSLLKRLCEGKPLLPEPPPRRFSYPDYDLVDNGFASPLEVWFPEGRPVDVVVIDQTEWTIVERRGERDLIAAYRIVDSAELKKLAHEAYRSLETFLRERVVSLPYKQATQLYHVFSDGQIEHGRLRWRIERPPTDRAFDV